MPYIFGSSVQVFAFCSPTNPFTTLKPQNPTHDVSEVHKISWSPDFEPLKFRKGRSGVSGHVRYPTRFIDNNSYITKVFKKWYVQGLKIGSVILHFQKKIGNLGGWYWMKKRKMIETFLPFRGPFSPEWFVCCFCFCCCCCCCCTVHNLKLQGTKSRLDFRATWVTKKRPTEDSNRDSS